MIQSKEDYLYYLECDRVALKAYKKRPPFMKVAGYETWRFERLMRKLEYYVNCRKNPFVRRYLRFRYHQLQIKYGYHIPINVFGPGLSIAHIGPILINSNSKIGKNCRIQTGVTLGATNGTSGAPVLGDNVFLGEGCKIIGNVTIANHCAIGANAVVVKSIVEEGTTYGGIPAKKISSNSSAPNLVNATEIVDNATKQNVEKK